MATEYKVISDWHNWSAGHKARKIEAHLNELAALGWEFVALDPLTLLGFDFGFYLILKREVAEARGEAPLKKVG